MAPEIDSASGTYGELSRLALLRHALMSTRSRRAFIPDEYLEILLQVRAEPNRRYARHIKELTDAE